jgi:hypothetical protein
MRLQAATQKQIHGIFKPNPFILKVLFERVRQIHLVGYVSMLSVTWSQQWVHSEAQFPVLQMLSWLQFGATPVGVGDGAMPYEKAGVLRARGIIKDLPQQPSEVLRYHAWHASCMSCLRVMGELSAIGSKCTLHP